MPPANKRPDRSEVLNFDQKKLHHVPTTEKVVLPSKEGKLLLKANKMEEITVDCCSEYDYYYFHFAFDTFIYVPINTQLFFPQCNLCVTLSKIAQKFPMNLSVLLPNNQLKEVWDNTIDVKPGHQQRRHTVHNIL